VYYLKKHDTQCVHVAILYNRYTPNNE